MTQPLGQGPSTWARTTHLSALEWGMSRKKILSLFSGAPNEGRDPKTGERVLALPSALPPIPELHVFASVTFDDEERLASITLKSDSPRPEGATDAVLLQAANKVMAALDAEPLKALPAKPMSWARKHTRVVVEYDDECFWFELSPT